MLFLIAIYSPKNDKLPSEMKNEHHISHFTITEVFPGLGPILTTGLKYWPVIKFLQIFFCLQTVLLKKKKKTVSQAVIQADLCTPMWIGLRDFDISYAVMLCEFFLLYLLMLKRIPEI